MANWESSITIGAISEGTSRPEDLVPTFAGVLQEHAPDLYDAWCDAFPNARDEAADPEMLTEAQFALEDDLTSLAPPYVRFGSNEGDGASYGFWPDWDALDQDAVAVTPPRHNPTPEVLKAETPPGYILVVNDHGNATLYRVALEEVWSVV